MFECVNCRKEKPDSEEGSVNLIAKIGFSVIFFFAKDLRWPSKTCKDCVTKISLFGMAGFALAVIVLMVGLFYWLGRM
jgi:hypothetical protein